MADEPIRYDVDSYDEVTKAVNDLINEHPEIPSTIVYGTLPDSGGISMFPTNGAVIQREIRSVTGKVRQECVYPFCVVFRISAGTNQSRKINAAEWLDGLGKWLEQKEEYPSLTDNRKFTAFQRTTTASLEVVNDDKSEDWTIYISANYEHEFRR